MMKIRIVLFTLILLPSIILAQQQTLSPRYQILLNMPEVEEDLSLEKNILLGKALSPIQEYHLGLEYFNKKNQQKGDTVFEQCQSDFDSKCRQTDSQTSKLLTALKQDYKELAISKRKSLVSFMPVNASRNGAELTKSSVYQEYYTSRFLIPKKRSEIQKTSQDYEGALNSLFEIYYEDSFVETSNVAIPKPAFITSNRTSSLIQLTSVDTKKTNRHELITDIEQAYVKQAVAETYIAWGKDLYYNKAASKVDILSKFQQVSKIYGEQVSSKFSGSFNRRPSYEKSLLLEAQSFSFMIENDLAAYGYSNDYIPIWDYVYLRDKAKEFIGHAKELEQRIFDITSRIDELNEKGILLDQSVDMARRNVALQAANTQLATQSLAVAQANNKLAVTRVENKQEQRDSYKDLHPIATSKDVQKGVDIGVNSAAILAGASSVGPVGVAIGAVVGLGRKLFKKKKRKKKKKKQLNATPVVAEAGYYTGSIAGFSTSGLYQMKMAEEGLYNLERELEEIKKMEKIAAQEVTRDSQALEVAKIQQANAEQELSNQQELLDAFNDRKLTPEVLTILKEDIKKIFDAYLQYGARLAWLAERAYEIEELDRINVIKTPNQYKSGTEFLAADLLLLDLNSIEFKRINEKQIKENHVSYYVSLRDKSGYLMDQLRSTGEIDFNISQYELDLAYPGTYRRVIDKVNITVVALTNSGGVKGSLTKHGFSWLKVPKSFAYYKSAVSDWMNTAYYDYTLQVNKERTETFIFPSSDDSINEDSEGQKDIFEGLYVGGNYTLKLPKYSNDFDFNTILDVIVEIDFSAYYDPNLQSVVENQLCILSGRNNTNGRMTSYSFKNDYPDEFYHFQNSNLSDSLLSKHRFIPFYVDEADYPTNHTDPQLRSLWLSFAGEDGDLIPVNVQLTSTSLNPNIAFDYENGNLVFEDSTKTMDDLQWFSEFDGDEFSYVVDENSNDTIYTRTASITGRSDILFGLWIVRIDADKNPLLTVNNPDNAFFDRKRLSTLGDCIMHYGYNYKFDHCTYSNSTIEQSNLTFITDITEKYYSSRDRDKEVIYFYANDKRVVWDWNGYGVTVKTDLQNKKFIIEKGSSMIPAGGGIPLEGIIRYKIDYTPSDDVAYPQNAYFKLPRGMGGIVSRNGDNREWIIFTQGFGTFHLDKFSSSTPINVNKPLEITIRYRASLDGKILFFEYFLDDQEEPFFATEGAYAYTQLGPFFGFGVSPGLEIYNIEAYALGSADY